MGGSGVRQRFYRTIVVSTALVTNIWYVGSEELEKVMSAYPAAPGEPGLTGGTSSAALKEMKYVLQSADAHLL
jgi:hypothetical protein